MSTVDGPGLLRAAAQKLRDTAAKVTPGPWFDNGNGHVMYGEAGTGESPDALIAESWDAAWIALASPVLAEPLADQLEAIAELDETLGSGIGPVTARAVISALAVARAVLGGTE